MAKTRVIMVMCAIVTVMAIGALAAGIALPRWIQQRNF